MWRVQLNGVRVAKTIARELLDEAERVRAARYLREEPRHEFVGVRSVLRDLLGRYLGVDARDVSFDYGAHGKPKLAGEHSTPLAFNVSHSGGAALIAIGTQAGLGVDIEAHREIVDIDAIVERYFCEGERAVICASSDAERSGRFFRAWALKEAVMKFTGLGMSLAPTSFCLNLRSVHGHVLIEDPGQARDALRLCSLRDLTVPGGYSAALAIHDDPASQSVVRRFEYESENEEATY